MHISNLYIEWAKSQKTNASEFLKSVIDRCLDGSIDVSTFQVKPSIQGENLTNLDERIDKYLENNIDKYIDERIDERANAAIATYSDRLSILETKLEPVIQAQADIESILGKSPA